MLSINTILTFSIASFLLCLAPGPDNIFVLTQSIAYGKKLGISVTLGLCTGLVFHTLAVAIGVATIIMTSAILFNLLKVAGAIYLLYLAYKAFSSKDTSINSNAVKELNFFKLYKRGIIMNITNPKVSVFFLAFLPQFTDASNGSVSLQIILLGLIFIFFTLIIFGTIAIISGIIGDLLKKSPKIQLYINKLTSFIFASLALKLILSKK